MDGQLHLTHGPETNNKEKSSSSVETIPRLRISGQLPASIVNGGGDSF